MQDSLRYESDLWKKDRISYYLKTKDVHPEDYNALLYRGMQNLRNELYEEAISDFKASLDATLIRKDVVPSLSKNKHKSESYFYIGICFELLDRADSAQYFLLKAIELNPYYDDAYIEHASIDLRNGRAEAALNTLLNAYDNNNKSRKLLSTLAALYIENGRLQKAKRLLKTAEKVTPGYSDPYISLAIIYLMESKINTAGLCMVRMGRIEEALKLYEAYAAIPGIDSHIHCKEAILKLQNLYHQDIFKQDISNILTEVFDIEP